MLVRQRVMWGMIELCKGFARQVSNKALHSARPLVGLAGKAVGVVGVKGSNITRVKNMAALKRVRCGIES